MSDRHLDPPDDPKVPTCCGRPMEEDEELNLTCSKCGMFWPAFDFKDDGGPVESHA